MIFDTDENDFSYEPETEYIINEENSNNVKKTYHNILKK